jgi:hypothetical protein
VPYSTKAAEELLKKTPTKFVSPETAIDLAKSAYQRALFLHFQMSVEKSSDSSIISKFVESATKVVGVGCTAAIVTDRERKGFNHAYVGIYTNEGYKTYELNMEKGARDREGEEIMVSLLILRAIIETSLNTAQEEVRNARNEFIQYTDSLFKNGEKIESTINVSHGNKALTSVFFQDDSQKYALYYVSNPTDPNSKKLEMGDDVSVLFNRPQNTNKDFVRLIYSGSYNPIHVGHYSLLKTAIGIIRDKFGKECAPIFDLGILNADKNKLDEETVRSRLGNFNQDIETAVLLTRAPLFIEKAKLFPGSYFLIGADTAKRLVDKKYYNNSETDLVQALLTFNALGSVFLVAGRKVEDKFITLRDITIPNGFQHMFHEIPEEEFRIDISSTEIRQRLKQ